MTRGTILVLRALLLSGTETEIRALGVGRLVMPFPEAFRNSGVQGNMPLGFAGFGSPSFPRDQRWRLLSSPDSKAHLPTPRSQGCLSRT